MTAPAAPPASGEIVPRRPGQPIGALPRWQQLYQAMAGLAPGALLRYEDMGEVLGLDFQNLRGKQAILAAARKAADQLREHDRKVFIIVRGHGYQLAQPGQVLAAAHRHQARAVGEVQAGHAKVDTIDLGQLDVTTRRLVEATAMGFARQEAIMRQFDVRQQRLETAMAALTATTHTVAEQAAQTSNRVDANEAEIAQLRQRLAELETTRTGRQPPAPP
ncbi:hypothetical protein [Dactylosporangium sp. CA-092794]|uniref:hypothetical protein n=1 Tax=Dactylosporangium sp. CA-092794 TaxID=3239929 RepID=UPI003D945B8A